MTEISPYDRDILIRTILGEAEDEPPAGQAGVAHAVLNRMATGRWGDTPSSVVLAPGQFEPWQKRSKELMAIRPESPRYKKAAAIVDGVLSGDIPDPTGGATHFLDPAVVRQRRGGTLPDWADSAGQTATIGGHAFFRPNEDALHPTRVSTAAVLDAVPDHLGAWREQMARGGAGGGATASSARHGDA